MENVIAPLVKDLDPIFIIRISSTFSTAWFDAIAPYQSNNKGMYSTLLSKVPAIDNTILNKNIATAVASKRISEFFFSTDRSATLLVNKYFTSLFNGTTIDYMNPSTVDVAYDPLCIGK
jgi:hypothetical protein